MAEPLSTIASVIALCQATAAFMKGSQFIASLPKAPAEFHDLANELTTTCLYLDDIHNTLAEITSPASPYRVRDFRSVTTTVGDLEARATELNKFVTELASNAKGVDKDGHLRIHKIKWQFQQDRVRQQRDAIRQARSAVVGAFQLLQTRQSVAHGQMLFYIQSTLKPMLESNPSRSAVIEDASVIRNKPLIGPQNSASLERGPADTLTPSNQASPAHSKREPRAYQLEAVVEPRCPPLCKCQCHRLQTSQSPDFLSSLMGKFVLSSYGMAPIWGKPSCTLPTCRRISKKPARLNYTFPSWMLKRAIHLTLSTANTASLGIQIDFPRIIPFHSAAFSAISDKSVVKLQYMFSIGTASPIDVDEDGYSLLLHAVNNEAWDVVEFLLTNRVDVTICDNSGRSPLSEIKQLQFSNPNSAHRDIYERVVNSENQEDPDLTLLHEVVMGSIETDLLTVISATPASVNALDGCGYAPIHWAVLNESLNNQLSSIALLLEKGADVNLKTRSGETALYFAVLYESQEVVELLLNAGADVNLCTSAGISPLRMASQYLELHLVKLLLEAGANPQQVDIDGETALHKLARSVDFHSTYSIDVAALAHELVRAGGRLEELNKWGDTPLLLAVNRNNAKAVHALYHLGARLDASSNNGRTVLHYAAYNGTWELFTALREAVPDLCVDPDLEDIYGDPAMENFEWRISLGELSEQDLTVATLNGDVPLLSEDEIDCFWELINEIREKHNFPEGGTRRRQASVGAVMPGGWSSDVKETDEDSVEEEDEVCSGTNGGVSDEDESWDTASESA